MSELGLQGCPTSNATTCTTSGFLRLRAGIGLASQSLQMASLLVVLLAMTSGCVLPPDTTFVEPINQPPRITRPEPDPSLGFVIQGCGTRSYAASIVDPDSQALYWRVFVDYPRKDDQTPQGGQAESGARVSFLVQDNDPNFRGGTLVPHLVELMVSDFPFDAVTGRTVPEGAGTDSMLWTVQYVTSDQCE